MNQKINTSKIITNHVINSLIIAAIFTWLYFFCLHITHGFRPYLILSNLPNDSRWQTPPLAPQEQKEMYSLLDQPFTFLGSGGWCFAFLGQDQHTVLKFYRHNHLLPLSILKDFSMDKLFLKSCPLTESTSYFQEFNFKSCMLLYSLSKERSGLLHIHLNKTKGLYPTVSLMDCTGVCHQIELDKTEFVVQRKAELLYPHIDNLMRAQKSKQAELCIDDLFQCLLKFYHNGVKDHDQSLPNNFGFIDDKAVTLDLSSFGFDETIMQPENYKKEIALKTWRLRRWLKKHHYALYLYYETQLKQLIEAQEEIQIQNIHP